MSHHFGCPKRNNLYADCECAAIDQREHTEQLRRYNENASKDTDAEMDAMKIGLEWQNDSSLEKWFPISAEQIAQLTKERDELQTQLDAWHAEFETTQLTHASGAVMHLEKQVSLLKSERDQLAAKCAEMREAVKANDEHHMLVDDQGNYLGSKLYCINDHALSNQCGVGWLSPEKKKVLVEALQFYSNEWNSDGGKVAKQALEETQQ